MKLFLYYILALVLTSWPLFEKQYRAKHYLKVMAEHDISHIWTTTIEQSHHHYSASQTTMFHNSNNNNNNNQHAFKNTFDLFLKGRSSSSAGSWKNYDYTSAFFNHSEHIFSYLTTDKTVKEMTRDIANLYLDGYANIWSYFIVVYLDFYWEGRSASSICAHNDADEIDIWRRESIACKRRIFNGAERIILLYHTVLGILITYAFHSYVWFKQIVRMMDTRHVMQN
jgi:hypothetical protein